MSAQVIDFEAIAARTKAGGPDRQRNLAEKQEAYDRIKNAEIDAIPDDIKVLHGAVRNAEDLAKVDEDSSNTLFNNIIDKLGEYLDYLREHIESRGQGQLLKETVTTVREYAQPTAPPLPTECEPINRADVEQAILIPLVEPPLAIQHEGFRTLARAELSNDKASMNSLIAEIIKFSEKATGGPFKDVRQAHGDDKMTAIRVHLGKYVMEVIASGFVVQPGQAPEEPTASNYDGIVADIEKLTTKATPAELEVIYARIAKIGFVADVQEMLAAKVKEQVKNLLPIQSIREGMARVRRDIYSRSQITRQMQWKDYLQLRDDNGLPVANSLNVSIALEQHPDLVGAFFYDEFSQTIKVARSLPWSSAHVERYREFGDMDITQLMIFMQANGIQVGKDQTHAAITKVADDHKRNLIHEHFNSLKWDGKPRLEYWLARATGNADSDYLSEVGTRWIMSIAARAFALNSTTWMSDPRFGCKVDYLPVFIGPQGFNKSAVGAALVGHEYAGELTVDVTDKDAVQQMFGSLLKEIPEIDKLRGKEVGEVKTFITIQCDKVRLPYGRVSENYPRTCVLFATSNEEQFTEDKTGGRRFWPVQVYKPVNIELIHGCRNQLFAEALHRLHQREKWWPTSKEFFAVAEEKQDAMRNEDPWEALVRAMLFNDAGEAQAWITSEPIFDMLSVEPGQRYSVQGARLGKILRLFGYSKKKKLRIGNGAVIPVAWVHESEKVRRGMS